MDADRDCFCHMWWRDCVVLFEDIDNWRLYHWDVAWFFIFPVVLSALADKGQTESFFWKFGLIEKQKARTYFRRGRNS